MKISYTRNDRLCREGETVEQDGREDGAVSSPTVRRRELASRLKELRLRAKLTLEEAGPAIDVSAATMSRLENGARPPSVRDVRDLCARYHASEEEAADLMGLAEASKESGWWESYSEVNEEYGTYIGLEAAATRIRDYRGIMIPGTLQTSGYLEEHIRLAANTWRLNPFTEDQIVNRAAILVRRQQRLDGRDPLQYECYLDEAAVMRPVGTSSVFVEQLQHLIEMQKRENVSIRLIPFSAGAHPGQLGGFTYLTLPTEAVSDVVYVESVAGQLFLEAPDELARFELALGQLDSIACSKDETVDRLRSMIVTS
jgi:transcriptional regulator with XRE-family HTH domain